MPGPEEGCGLGPVLGPVLGPGDGRGEGVELPLPGAGDGRGELPGAVGAVVDGLGRGETDGAALGPVLGFGEAGAVGVVGRPLPSPGVPGVKLGRGRGEKLGVGDGEVCAAACDETASNVQAAMTVIDLVFLRLFIFVLPISAGPLSKSGASI